MDKKTSRLNRAYLSLGSNIEAEQNMQATFDLLARYTPETTLLAVSTVWETRPLGDTNQPNYLNAAAIIETSLSARDLRDRVLRQIEKRLGRIRGPDKFAPRPMDIDIILFNNDILKLDQREIPDSELLERAFVAIPMAELAPDYIHPITGQTLGQIAQEFEAETHLMRRRDDIIWASED